MNHNDTHLSTWQASCIITGYGIGGGIMSIPYLVDRSGLLPGLAIFLVSLLASYILHLMIADLALKMDESEGGQIISCLNKYLFRGKYKNVLTIVFCVLMLICLLANLAGYITGAEEVLVELLPLSSFWCKVLFYIVAAAVVFFGLKAVGVSESVAVPAIFILIGILAVASFFAPSYPLNLFSGSANERLALYSMTMFALSAFFSVPQTVEALDRDENKIRKAILIGFLNNLIIMLVVTLCALSVSPEVTEVAMVGWSAGIGTWAQIVGGLFTVLAMLTTYWSLSLALSSVVAEQFSLSGRLSWLIATVPTFILSVLNFASFMEFMRIAGGLIALIIAILIVPAFSNAMKDTGSSILGKFSGPAVRVLIIIAYILMGVGSVIPV